MADKKPRVSRDPVPLARAVTIALWAYIGSEVISATATLVELQVLAAYGADEPLTIWDELPTSGAQDLIIVVGGLAIVLGYLVAGFLTLKWIYRVNLNAKVLAPGKEVSPAWSVGWFFVPFASLVMPFKAMRETWQISQSPSGWRSVKTPPLLRWWWGLFLATILLDNVATRMWFKADTAGLMVLSDQMTVASTILAIPLTLVLLNIVRHITDAQAGLLAAPNSASE